MHRHKADPAGQVIRRGLGAEVMCASAHTKLHIHTPAPRDRATMDLQEWEQGKPQVVVAAQCRVLFSLLHNAALSAREKMNVYSLSSVFFFPVHLYCPITQQEKYKQTQVFAVQFLQVVVHFKTY